MNQLQLLGALEIGIIYGLVAIGVYITFKIIDFPDLTVDGSFTLGAAVSAALIANGMNPFLATFLAIISGSVAGMITGYLNVRWNILGLLAGILTMTGLYSINLRIMGKPNIAIIDEQTIFSGYSIIIVALIILVITTLLLTRFFASEFGLGIRAAGINARISNAYGINVGKMKIIALALSNAIVAFAGALFTQSQSFADISMGTGTVIIGLASVIIGEAMLRPHRILTGLITCALGSVIYRIAIGFALNVNDVGLEASDLNLITVLLVVFTMILPRLKKIKIN
jgi:putative ABC transport system permease protein